MRYEVIIALIGAGSALIGAFVGGLSSYFLNIKSKQIEWENSVKKDELSERKKLYSAYMHEVNNVLFQSIEGEIERAEELKKLTNILSEMQILSSKEVLSSADKITNYIFSYQEQSDEQKMELKKLRKELSKNMKIELERMKKA